MIKIEDEIRKHDELAGTHIYKAVENLYKKAIKNKKPYVLTFNGIKIIVIPNIN